MAICILRLQPGQKIPRPFNRAISVAELLEILCYWTRANIHRGGPDHFIKDNIDSEEPIYTYTNPVGGQTKFFAFWEA